MEQVKLLTYEVTRLRETNEEKSQFHKELAETSQSRSLVVFSANGMRIMCKLCTKWVAILARRHKQMTSPWICEGFEVTSIKSKATNRPFDNHECSKTHRDAMKYEAGQMSIFEVIAQSAEMYKLRNIVRVCHLLAKLHCSDNFYEDVCYLHDQGVKTGDWNHSRKASHAIKENIANGLIDRKKHFFLTPNLVTGQKPSGYMADEVSRGQTTFDCELLQVVENGRPKAMHLKAQEITTASINNEALTKYAAANICSDMGIEKDDFRSRVPGMATDAASVYRGKRESLVANIRILDPQFQCNHDRMHRLNLGFNAGLKKFPKLQGVSDCATKLYGYFSHARKSHEPPTKFSSNSVLRLNTGTCTNCAHK